MREEKKGWFIPIILGTVAILVWFSSLRLLYPPYLTFSDSAKFADAAREMVRGESFGARFAFFDPRYVFTPVRPFVPGFGILNAFFILAFFKVLGVGDFAVVFTSGFFFVGSALLVYFLAKELFDRKVAFFSSLAFIFTQPLLDYASIGASEISFIFFFLASCFLIFKKKKYSIPVSAVFASLLFLIRSQALIYLIGLAIFVYFYSEKDKAKRLFNWLGAFVLSMIFLFLLSKATGQGFIYFRVVPSLFAERGSTFENASLRGGIDDPYLTILVEIKPLIKKVFYNLYNFYKSLPGFVSSYLVSLYLLSLVRWDRRREVNTLQLASLFILVFSFLVSSAIIPFMRYIHPVAPLVIIFSVEMLFWILTRIFKEEKKVLIACTLFILFFVIGQTLGKIFLDSRYLRTHTNQGKPPVYVKLAQILRENTEPDDLIITNLDTWGTWYGERRTIWFPLEPSQLAPPEGKDLAASVIFLTSYKMDDRSSYMGEAWREIFYHPEELEDPFFARNFVLEKKFEVKPEETYEREGAMAILLTKKEK